MAQILDPTEIMFTPFEPKLQNRFIMYVEGVPAYLIKKVARPSITFEEVVLEKLNELHKKYNLESLCLAGGCAFNSSLNGKIISKSKFKNVYFSPNVGDAGGAIGAALYVAKEKNLKLDKNMSPYLGSHYSNKYVFENIISKIKNDNFIKYLSI